MRHLLLSFHSCPYEPPGSGFSGGMNVFLSGLLPALASFGVETDVLTRGFGDTVAIARPSPGVRVIHLPCGWDRASQTREGAWRALPRFIASARNFLGGRAGYEAMSAHYWMSAVAAQALSRSAGHRPGRLPLAFCYHTIEARKETAPGTRPDDFSRKRMATERSLAGSVESVVCLSSFDLAETVACFPEAGPRGTVIPPGLDDRFARAPERADARAALGLEAGGTLFLLAARNDPGKNAAEAVEAVRRLRAQPGGSTVSLIVVGQECPPGTFPADGVAFAGAVPHGMMPSYYAAVDAVVCPSRYESFGLVPLEALGAGTPVVAPETVYWGRRVKGGGGGLAYDPGVAGALEAAMGRIASDAALRERLAAECRRIAAPFRWSRCAASWASLLSRLSSRDGRPGTPRARAAPRRR